MLVLAGAGSGKTATLTQRVIKLIESGVHPQSILAITFTNKAAGEMKQRIRRAIESNPAITFPVYEYGITPWVGTFHALGIMIIKEQHQKVGVKKHFAIYDRDDSRRAVKEAIKRSQLDPTQWEAKKILAFISTNKGNFVSLADFQAEPSDSFYTDNLITIWQHYEEIKKADQALDFDDLLLETAQLLDKNPSLRDLYHSRFQHLHVDEYQDTNRVQHKIIKLLVNRKTQNIFCVGDPDQLIYGWRGAQISHILRFEKDFSPAQVVILEQNYRSSGNIIAGSNAVIAQNQKRFEKNLFTEAPAGEAISLYGAYDAREEAWWVATTIKNILTEGESKPNDIAVLYRANFQSRALEEACLRHDIPYQVLGTKFFDRSEVKDVLSYIKVALNPEALIDFRRVINTPRRGIGKVSLAKILAKREEGLSRKVTTELEKFRNLLQAIRHQAEEVSPRELVSFVITHSGLEEMYRESGREEDTERLANMYELAVVAEKYDALPQEEALEQFLTDVALMSDQDTTQEGEERVKLMTIHASKGLEFPQVCITGCEESLFSVDADMEGRAAEEKAEEERRLFYVAMTRAKDKLLLSWASLREVFGTTVVNTMVPFIMDIPPSLLAEEISVGQAIFRPSQSRPSLEGIDEPACEEEPVIELLDE